ncbi:MAG: SLC13 family permease [Gordonia sp. (in: high G+C Gram-positive bacteria)]|uniref:SLC13 family permease n=1 Tax=Gordonia sp. (in: high G+C Gram-positive bacteria) TaxID=84139 RepID=UPI003C72929C
MRTLVPAAAGIVGAGGWLLATAPRDAAALAERLGPVLLFVAAMSVVVNLAADAGAFGYLAAWLQQRRWPGLPARAATWVQVVVLATVSTVFFSLDTTAIMVTPLAVVLARRSGADVWAVGLTVVWIANLGSLLLPVSNLTNLLAVSGGMFGGTGDYLATMWRPALVAAALAVLASAVVYRHRSRDRVSADPAVPRGAPGPLDARLRVSLGTLGCLLPLLVSPVPYWLSATAAAAVLVVVGIRTAPTSLSVRLVPWSSLLLVTALSTGAAALHAAGAAAWIGARVMQWETSTAGLMLLGAVGALLANAVNNIPAFLALDVGVGDVAGMAALLIGVNAGPVVTPWASLATLLWHDQLRRSGVDVRWRRFVMAGLLLAPLAVAAPILAI